MFTRFYREQIWEKIWEKMAHGFQTCPKNSKGPNTSKICPKSSKYATKLEHTDMVLYISLQHIKAYHNISM